MSLTELEAYFVGEYNDVAPNGHVTLRRLDSVEGAQGVQFLCPKCFKENKGPIGTHSILCWFLNPRNALNVPDEADPKPGRWIFEGEKLEELSFVGPAAASILLTSGCGWHGFIRSGKTSDT